MINWGINRSNGRRPENWTPYGKFEVSKTGVEERKPNKPTNIRVSGGFVVEEKGNTVRATQRAFAAIDARNRPVGEPVTNQMSFYSC